MVTKTLLYGVLINLFILVWSDGEMGPGLWHVQHVKKCEQDGHKFKFDIGVKKINRTHDGFFGSFILTDVFDKRFGFRADICKNMDGGCKPVSNLADTCFVDFVNRFAEENVKKCLEVAGVAPPEFPIEAGEYEVENYVFDYTELPEEAPYGSYAATAYMLENNEEVGCIEIHCDFEPIEDSEE